MYLPAVNDNGRCIWGIRRLEFPHEFDHVEQRRDTLGNSTIREFRIVQMCKFAGFTATRRLQVTNHKLVVVAFLLFDLHTRSFYDISRSLVAKF